MSAQPETTMLSRVADSLYWMSRYLERAEHTARVLDVDMQLRLDQSTESRPEHWLRLLEAFHLPVSIGDEVDGNTVIEMLTVDRSNPSSIVSTISAVRENLRHVREQCSSEMWELLNRFYLEVTAAKADKSIITSHSFFRAVQEGAHMFHGVTDSTMNHGEGWQYIQLGRYVERIDALASLISVHLSRIDHPLDQAVESGEYLEWVGLLKSCTAFEAYCKHYSAELRPQRVAEFLLLNPEFPHSVRFSVDMVHAALRAIGELTDRRAEYGLRLTGRLRASLSFSQIDEIMDSGAHAFMENIRQHCAQAHMAIHQVYFDYPIESELVS